jgi:hypothetical protein
MYFYNYKTYKNEKDKLLEMCGAAGISFGHGACIHGVVFKSII